MNKKILKILLIFAILTGCAFVASPKICEDNSKQILNSKTGGCNEFYKQP